MKFLIKACKQEYHMRLVILLIFAQVITFDTLGKRLILRVSCLGDPQIYYGSYTVAESLLSKDI